MINWNVSDEERRLIIDISKRASNLLGVGLIDTQMDITAVHNNDVKLNLQKLLNADDFNFAHDINGISGHLDRNTGKLLRGFLPRHAL